MFPKSYWPGGYYGGDYWPGAVSAPAPTTDTHGGGDPVLYALHQRRLRNEQAELLALLIADDI